MTTYKVQQKSGNVWHNLTNIKGIDMEFISIDDAKTIADVYSAYHRSSLVENWKIVDSHGNYHQSV